jgi:hypothetical protein
VRQALPDENRRLLISLQLAARTQCRTTPLQPVGVCACYVAFPVAKAAPQRTAPARRSERTKLLISHRNKHVSPISRPASRVRCTAADATAIGAGSMWRYRDKDVVDNNSQFLWISL